MDNLDTLSSDLACLSLGPVVSFDPLESTIGRTLSISSPPPYWRSTTSKAQDAATVAHRKNEVADNKESGYYSLSSFPRTYLHLKLRRQSARVKKRSNGQLFALPPKDDETGEVKPVVKFDFVLPSFHARWSELASATRSKKERGRSTCASRGRYTNLKVEPPIVDCTVSRKPGPVKRYVFDPFRFLDLPRELRDAIYEFTFSECSEKSRPCISLNQPHRNVDAETDTSEPPSLNMKPQTTKKELKISGLPAGIYDLLRSCKQIHQECIPILYRQQVFLTRGIKLIPRLTDTMYRSGLAYGTQIRHLEISFVGKTAKEQIFDNVNFVHKLPQLEELDLLFDMATLSGLRAAFLDGRINKLCQHRKIDCENDDKAARKLADLMTSVIEHGGSRTIKFKFTGGGSSGANAGANGRRRGSGSSSSSCPSSERRVDRDGLEVSNNLLNAANDDAGVEKSIEDGVDMRNDYTSDTQYLLETPEKEAIDFTKPFRVPTDCIPCGIITAFERFVSAVDSKYARWQKRKPIIIQAPRTSSHLGPPTFGQELKIGAEMEPILTRERMPRWTY